MAIARPDSPHPRPWPDGTHQALHVYFPLSGTLFHLPLPMSSPPSWSHLGHPAPSPYSAWQPCFPSSGPPGPWLSGPSRASVFEDLRHSHLLGWLRGGLKVITGHRPAPALSLPRGHSCIVAACFHISDHVVPGTAWHTVVH